MESLSLRDKYIQLMIVLSKHYEVINGYGKGGFWMRNLDGSKVGFTDEHNFVAYAEARKLARTIPTMR